MMAAEDSRMFPSGTRCTSGWLDHFPLKVHRLHSRLTEICEPNESKCHISSSCNSQYSGSHVAQFSTESFRHKLAH